MATICLDGFKRDHYERKIELDSQFVAGVAHNIWALTPEEVANLNSFVRDPLVNQNQVVLLEENKENTSSPVFPVPSFEDSPALQFQQLFVASAQSPDSDGQENKSPEGVAKKWCAFCKRNGESVEVYQSHSLRDSQQNVVCPVLFKYRCPLCGATGSQAHTKQYCPQFRCQSNVKSSKKNSLGKFVHHYR